MGMHIDTYNIRKYKLIMEIEGSLVYDVCKDVLCGAVPTGES
jgi:hypothetical protein